MRINIILCFLIIRLFPSDNSESCLILFILNCKPLKFFYYILLHHERNQILQITCVQCPFSRAILKISYHTTNQVFFKLDFTPFIHRLCYLKYTYSAHILDIKFIDLGKWQKYEPLKIRASNPVFLITDSKIQEIISPLEILFNQIKS